MNNLPEYFEATARRFPDKTAVACREQAYTFSRLRDIARRLAARIARTAEPGSPVGVLVSRDCDTAVFFLSALYAGCFYVPIDPAMPSGKIAAILEDSGARTALCGEEERACLEALNYEGQILTAADAEEGAGSRQAEPARNPGEDSSVPGSRQAEPTQDPGGDAPVPDSAADAGSNLPGLACSGDDPACLIYTSGSTGRPKGVLKSHGAFIHFMEAYIREFGLTSEEIIGNQTPFFFDASAKDFYLMIFTGATLEILPSELFVFPRTLIEYMNERRVSYICWVPTALTLVTQMKTFSEILPTSLRRVFFVGEVFPLRHLRQWMETLPDIEYVNLYGSTELAGICCFARLTAPPAAEAAAIPMGRALPGCAVFLSDGERIVTEPGVTGEVCVAGGSLALGYFHDPERTAAAFPTRKIPGGSEARVLRTGDMARYGEDGQLYFISRKDDQIKHMGHRIELGEIEACARTVPEITACCCLYNEKKRQICLFCTLAPGCGWDRRRVRQEMYRRVSEYMVPSKVIVLDELPLNANGKTDRMRLREML